MWIPATFVVTRPVIAGAVDQTQRGLRLVLVLFAPHIVTTVSAATPCFAVTETLAVVCDLHAYAAINGIDTATCQGKQCHYTQNTKDSSHWYLLTKKCSNSKADIRGMDMVCQYQKKIFFMDNDNPAAYGTFDNLPFSFPVL